MLETVTKLWKIGGTVVITIPISILNDSNFPFLVKPILDDEKEVIEPLALNIKIDNKKLVIEKKQKKEVNKK